MFLTEIEQLNTMLQKKEQSQQQNQAFQQNAWRIFALKPVHRKKYIVFDGKKKIWKYFSCLL